MVWECGFELPTDWGGMDGIRVNVWMRWRWDWETMPIIICIIGILGLQDALWVTLPPVNVLSIYTLKSLDLSLWIGLSESLFYNKHFPFLCGRTTGLTTKIAKAAGCIALMYLSLHLCQKWSAMYCTFRNWFWNLACLTWSDCNWL